MKDKNDNTENKPIYVTRSSMPTFEEYIDEIKSLWDTHKLTNMGEKHKELEEKIKGYLGVPNASLMVNGHMALELAIQAMNLSGEVNLFPVGRESQWQLRSRVGGNALRHAAFSRH